MYSDNAMNRPAVFAELRKRNITQVKVHFSGGNDEGGADSHVATLADGTKVELGRVTVYQDWRTKQHFAYEAGGQRPATDDEMAEQRLLDGLEQPIYDEYGSFAGEFSVDGIVTWNVKDEKVSMAKEEQSGYDYSEYDV